MPNVNTQCARMVQYAKIHGSITVSEAQRELGINSPTRRICDLQKKGYDIRKVWEKGFNRFGEPTRYVRYFIDEIPN